MFVPACVTVLCAGFAFQTPDAGRQRILGEVQGRNGKPWVGAVVTLVGHSSLTRAGLARDDRIELRTNTRGRFRARILSDHVYEVWGASSADTGARVTRMATAVVPGKHIVLVEADPQPTALTLEVYGLAAWKPRGMRLEVAGRIVRPDAEGKVVLPRGPGQYVLLDGWVGDRRIFRRSITQMTEQRKLIAQKAAEPSGEPVAGLPDVAKLPAAAVDVERVLVPPPLEVTIRVLDKASKKPVAGAHVIGTRQGAEGCELVTGADGEAHVVIAHPIDAFGRHNENARNEYFVQAPGYALARTGWKISRFVRTPPLREADIEDGRAPVLEVELDKGFKFDGKVLLPEGMAANGLRVIYDLYAGETQGKNRYRTIHVGVREAEVGDDGTWQIAGLGPQRTKIEAELVLPEPLLATLCKDRPPLPTVSQLPLALPGLYRNSKDFEKTYDLRSLHAVDVSVEFPDGRPAEHALVRVRQKSDQSSGTSRIAQDLRCDRRGRCRVVTVAKETRLFVRTSTHYAVAVLGQASSATVRVEPMAWLRGRVVDSKNEPVFGAMIRVHSVGGWVGSTLDWTSWNLQALSGISDSQGRFSLRWVPTPGTTYKLRAHVRVGRNQLQSAETVRLEKSSVDDAVFTIGADVQALRKQK